MAYSKQNFQDGQILTAANLEKMENGIIAGQGAKNLLINSNFKNPINTQGKTTYTTNGWSIDKWYFYVPGGGSATLEIKEGYISFTGGSSASSISYRFPKGFIDKNKTYTSIYSDINGNINTAGLYF